MSRLQVSLACAAYDRVAAIRDGRVKIDGCDVNFLEAGPEEVFFRAYRHTEFDICELSMSSYLLALGRGTCAYTALPIFISRSFRHSAIYVHRPSGIHHPEALKGKRVGVPEYQVTAALWVRGILDDEYGITPSDFQWRTGGINEPGRIEKLSLTLPNSIRIEAIAPDSTLDAMLCEGAIAALITPRPPNSFIKGDPRVARLFPDYATLEQAYFQKTRIFPIMHAIGVRTALLEANPWLANSVVNAFVQSKNLALAAMSEVAALQVTLPWLSSHLEDTQRIMGADFWPYGVEANRATLEKMLDYAHRHGTTPRRLAIEDIFAPSTLTTFKV